MSRLLRLLSLYRPFYAWMALGILASLATLAANVTLMAVSGWFITSMALAGVAQVSMNYFTPAAIIRAAAIVRTGGRYVERLVTHEATLRLLAILRGWFYERIEPLAPAVLQRHHSGDLLSRIRADIDTLDNFYLRFLVPAITASIATLLFSLYLATYDTGFAVVLLSALIAAGAGVPWLALRFASEAGRRKQILLSEQRALLVDSLQGMGELLQSGAAERYVDQVRQNSIELVSQQTRLARVDGLSQAAALLCANLAMWLILWLAVPMVEQSQLAKADLAMLALFTLATFEAVNPMLSAFKAYGETRAAMERLFEIVDAPPAVRDPTASSPRPRKFDLCFERVSFGYPAAEEPVLQDFDLCMPEGGRVTITGPSGVGKSTLVHLLARFYDPDSGRILLGGQPLTRFRGEDLRRYLSVVSQHSHLFTGTVRDNLLLGDPRAGEEALERAGRVAGIHDFIASLPDGYDTWVGEAGATLSGGEARRIALARAVLKDAPVLILDEPTEGLDASTAAGILKAVDQWAIGKTVVLISHRRLTGDAFGPVVKLDA